MNEPKLSALPNTPSQMTGCIREMKSWIGLPYHFLRSLCVRAQRPWSGPVSAFGGDPKEAAEAGWGCGWGSSSADDRTFSLIFSPSRPRPVHGHPLREGLEFVARLVPQGAAGQLEVGLVQGGLGERYLHDVKPLRTHQVHY